MILYISADEGVGKEGDDGKTEDGQADEGTKTTEVKCEEISSPTGASDCKKATDVKSDQECQFVAASGSTAAKCKKVTKATDSSNILNIFKITFALLIIFTIL
jgi:hypothetical protein